MYLVHEAKYSENLSNSFIKNPPMDTLTWDGRTHLMVRSLLATRTSWPGHRGLFFAVAVSNCSRLFYRLTSEQWEQTH